MKKLAVILLALVLAVAFSLPAMADGIEPYGSMRLGIYWANHDYNYSTTDTDDGYNPAWTTDDSDAGIMQQLAAISRFGAKGKVGDIFAQVELGLYGDKTTTEWSHDDNDVYMRLLYATWNFGGGSLTVGQDYTPLTWTADQQGPGMFDDFETQSYDLQNAFIGLGCLWDSRRPQIRVNLDNGLSLSLIQPEDQYLPGNHDYKRTVDTTNVALDTAYDSTDGIDADATLPKMVVAYDYKTEGLMLRPGFAYSTYSLKSTDATMVDDDVTSWIGFLHGKVDLGSVALKFTGHYGQNLTNYGISGRTNQWDHTTSTSAFDASSAYVVGKEVYNAKSWGGFLQAAIPMDPYTITLGWGYAGSKNDDVPTASADIDSDGRINNQTDDVMGFFANVKVPITDNFSVTPEFDYYDGMDNSDGESDPDHWYIGMTWQADF